MKYVLMIIGYGWAAWGAFSLAFMAFALAVSPDPMVMDDAGISFLIMAVVLMFLTHILPGLAVGGIGSNMK